MRLSCWECYTPTRQHQMMRGEGRVDSKNLIITVKDCATQLSEFRNYTKVFKAPNPIKQNETNAFVIIFMFIVIFQYFLMSSACLQFIHRSVSVMYEHILQVLVELELSTDCKLRTIRHCICSLKLDEDFFVFDVRIMEHRVLVSRRRNNRQLNGTRKAPFCNM